MTLGDPRDTRLACPSPSPRACSMDSCPLSQWCHPAISSCAVLLLLPSVFPSIRVFSSELALCIRWPKYWSFSFTISPSNNSGLISFRIDWFDLLAVHESPGDSQESSLASQFESINSSALSLLYGSTPTSLHDYWKGYSFDYTDLCWQSGISAF